MRYEEEGSVVQRYRATPSSIAADHGASPQPQQAPSSSPLPSTGSPAPPPPGRRRPPLATKSLSRTNVMHAPTTTTEMMTSHTKPPLYKLNYPNSAPRTGGSSGGGSPRTHRNMMMTNTDNDSHRIPRSKSSDRIVNEENTVSPASPIPFLAPSFSATPWRPFPLHRQQQCHHHHNHHHHQQQQHEKRQHHHQTEQQPYRAAPPPLLLVPHPPQPKHTQPMHIPVQGAIIKPRQRARRHSIYIQRQMPTLSKAPPGAAAAAAVTGKVVVPQQPKENHQYAPGTKTQQEEKEEGEFEFTVIGPSASTRGGRQHATIYEHMSPQQVKALLPSSTFSFHSGHTSKQGLVYVVRPRGVPAAASSPTSQQQHARRLRDQAVTLNPQGSNALSALNRHFDRRRKQRRKNRKIGYASPSPPLSHLSSALPSQKQQQVYTLNSRGTARRRARLLKEYRTAPVQHAWLRNRAGFFSTQYADPQNSFNSDDDESDAYVLHIRSRSDPVPFQMGEVAAHGSALDPLPKRSNVIIHGCCNQKNDDSELEPPVRHSNDPSAVPPRVEDHEEEPEEQHAAEQSHRILEDHGQARQDCELERARECAALEKAAEIEEKEARAVVAFRLRRDKQQRDARVRRESMEIVRLRLIAMARQDSEASATRDRQLLERLARARALRASAVLDGADAERRRLQALRNELRSRHVAARSHTQEREAQMRRKIEDVASLIERNEATIRRHMILESEIRIRAMREEAVRERRRLKRLELYRVDQTERHLVRRMRREAEFSRSGALDQAMRELGVGEDVLHKLKDNIAAHARGIAQVGAPPTDKSEAAVVRGGHHMPGQTDGPRTNEVGENGPPKGSGLQQQSTALRDSLGRAEDGHALDEVNDAKDLAAQLEKEMEAEMLLEEQRSVENEVALEEKEAAQARRRASRRFSSKAGALAKVLSGFGVVVQEESVAESRARRRSSVALSTMTPEMITALEQAEEKRRQEANAAKHLDGGIAEADEGLEVPEPVEEGTGDIESSEATMATDQSDATLPTIVQNVVVSPNETIEEVQTVSAAAPTQLGKDDGDERPLARELLHEEVDHLLESEVAQKVMVESPRLAQVTNDANVSLQAVRSGGRAAGDAVQTVSTVVKGTSSHHKTAEEVEKEVPVTTLMESNDVSAETTKGVAELPNASPDGEEDSDAYEVVAVAQD